MFILFSLLTSSGTLYCEMSTAADASGREAARNTVVSVYFSVCSPYIFNLKIFSSGLHLDKAHPGLETAHPMVQKQHSNDCKCLRKCCSFLWSVQECLVQQATVKTAKEKLELPHCSCMLLLTRDVVVYTHAGGRTNEWTTQKHKVFCLYFAEE